MKYALALISAFFVDLFFYFAGLLSGIVLPFYALIPAYGLIMILLLLSFLTRRRIKKDMDVSDLASFQNEFIKSQEEARSHYEAHQKEISADIKKTLIWIFLCAFSAVLLAIVTGMMDAGKDESSTASILIALYILISFFFWLFPEKSQKPDPSAFLSRDSYPALYQLTDEVFSEEMFRKKGKLPILVTDDSSNIAIMKDKDQVYILLGAMLTGVLKAEELKVILFHEKGHILSDDKDPQVRGNKLVHGHELAGDAFPLSGIGDYMMFGPLLQLGLKILMSDTFVNIIKEKAADTYATSKGSPTAFASGLANTYMLGLFEEHESDFLIRYYKDEEIPGDKVAKELDLFRECAKERQSFWLDLIMKELPARTDSHPTFPMRLETAGNPSFRVELTSDDPESSYAKEVKKMIKEVDQRIYEMNKDGYQALHEENWLKPLALIREFEEGLKTGKTYSALDMRPVLDACLATMEFEKLDQYCLMCMDLAKNKSEAAHASFLYGAKRLNAYDKSGIPYLYAAADENHNYREEAYDMIGRFCLQMNLPEELSEYRERSLRAMQLSMDL